LKYPSCCSHASIPYDIQTLHYIRFAIGPSPEFAPSAQPTPSDLRFGYHGYYTTDVTKAAAAAAAAAGGGGVGITFCVITILPKN
jgi:hypothetical protein